MRCCDEGTTGYKTYVNVRCWRSTERRWPEAMPERHNALLRILEALLLQCTVPEM